MPDGEAGGEEAGDTGRSSPHGFWRRHLRTTVSVAGLAVAGVLMAFHFGEIASAAHRLTQVDGGWIALAVGAEAMSMAVFARLQQRLLRAGGTRIRLRTMVGVTVAANAVTGTLPGGVGWAAAWLFNQLGHRGVSRFLRVWMFLVAGGVSSFALFMVVAGGVWSAGSHGPVASLRWLVFLLALIPLVALLLEAFHSTRLVQAVLSTSARLVCRLPGGRRIIGGADAVVSRFTAVRLRGWGWVEVLTLALANWLLDCVVVIAALEALRVPVPWSAILVIYGLTQISASIPITPGGVGVVAGSLGALLHAYGVPTSGAVAAVLLYRLLSYWALVPVGWGLWGILEWTARHSPDRLAVDGGPLRGKKEVPVPEPTDRPAGALAP